MPSSHNSSPLTIQKHLTIPCQCYVNPATGISTSPTMMYLTQIRTFFPWCWIPKLHKHQGPYSFLNLPHCRDNLKRVTLSLSWQTSLVSDFLFYSGTDGPQLLDIRLSYIINSQPKSVFCTLNLDFCTQLAKKYFGYHTRGNLKLSCELYFLSTKCQKGWSWWQCGLSLRSCKLCQALPV
jgi:hypothetical protein